MRDRTPHWLINNTLLRMENTIDRYTKISKAGEGTYGVVYKCKDTETGEVSRLSLSIFIDQDSPNLSLRLWLWNKFDLNMKRKGSPQQRSERFHFSRSSTILTWLDWRISSVSQRSFILSLSTSLKIWSISLISIPRRVEKSLNKTSRWVTQSNI